jgi:ribonuclease HIII
MVVFTNVKKEDVIKLKKLKFIPSAPKTVYEVIRYTKDGVTAILYESEKLLLQGKKESIDKVAELLERNGLGEKVKSQKFRKETGIIIGSDESMKGDTFGGLVVAGVKADNKQRKELVEIGVNDSKKLSDKEIILMAETIRLIVPCIVKSLLPEEYNHNGKITVMLNKLHQECADYLSPGQHVVDKYPGCNVGDIREEKAECKYVEVAAASILARAAALKQFNYLSKMAGFNIPKGSTHVKIALQELKERNLDFNKFVKISFSNVQEFL